jgi:predicted anti-sigma-YlaC factor YlaD
MAEMGAADVPYLFWTAAGWLLAASSDLEDPEMFGLFPVAGKIMMRAYELDPGWNGGMLPSTLISLAPNLPGGTRDDSRRYYEETLKITGGKTAGPYVSLANAVAVKEQDREQFMELMNKALAIDLDADPDARLANDYAQRRAAFLLEHIDDLIL